MTVPATEQFVPIGVYPESPVEYTDDFSDIRERFLTLADEYGVKSIFRPGARPDAPSTPTDPSCERAQEGPGAIPATATLCDEPVNFELQGLSTTDPSAHLQSKIPRQDSTGKAVGRVIERVLNRTNARRTLAAIGLVAACVSGAVAAQGVKTALQASKESSSVLFTPTLGGPPVSDNNRIVRQDRNSYNDYSVYMPYLKQQTFGFGERFG
ncbi:MAG TPA: hypothetical protein VGS08_00495 [Candidatus Saccharimonadales bacterium]|nr:hypothetical protein [Candidatus Saccharimonadales bacterium]